MKFGCYFTLMKGTILIPMVTAQLQSRTLIDNTSKVNKEQLMLSSSTLLIVGIRTKMLVIEELSFKTIVMPTEFRVLTYAHHIDKTKLSTF